MGTDWCTTGAQLNPAARRSRLARMASYAVVERTGNGRIWHGTFETREAAQARYDELVAQDDRYRDVLTILEDAPPPDN